MATVAMEFFCPFPAKRNRILRLRLRAAAFEPVLKSLRQVAQPQFRGRVCGGHPIRQKRKRL